VRRFRGLAHCLASTIPGMMRTDTKPAHMHATTTKRAKMNVP
jgi:hypothetical protein